MKPIFCMDLETFRFGPGYMAPKPVVMSWKCWTPADPIEGESEAQGLCHLKDETEWGYLEYILKSAAKGEVLIVGHHIAFDMCCICADRPQFFPLVFAAYDADGITDTEIRQKLLDIATGHYRGFYHRDGKDFKISYRLDDLVSRLFGVDLPKPKDVRVGYGDLWIVPIDQWTEEERRYAQDDSIAVYEIFKLQEGENNPTLKDQFRQARASFALQLTSTYGVHTDPIAVDELKQKTLTRIENVKQILLDTGLLRPDGTRNMAEAIRRIEAANPDGPKTPKGRASVSADACKDCGDPALEAWVDFVKAQNILSKDIPLLTAGIETPIHTRFEELVESGRTSSSKPNLQNMKREPGLRECIVPRSGNVFLACDFDKAELHALAQICILLFGWSKLGEALNEGRDPHLALGASMLGLSYETALERKKDPVIKKARQGAKAYNFGFPGGLGSTTFREYAKTTYGIEMTEDEAKAGKQKWLDTWPEMNLYFKKISEMCGSRGEATMVQVGSGRVREGCSFTVACNTLFQGLCADFAKDAMYRVAKEEYAVPESALYGCRTVNFIHDELLLEVPADIDLADAAAKRLKEVMETTAKPWTPDVPVHATPTLMTKWSKAAEQTFDAEGRLTPWTGEEK